MCYIFNFFVLLFQIISKLVHVVYDALEYGMEFEAERVLSPDLEGFLEKMAYAGTQNVIFVIFVIYSAIPSCGWHEMHGGDNRNLNLSPLSLVVCFTLLVEDLVKCKNNVIMMCNEVIR